MPTNIEALKDAVAKAKENKEISDKAKEEEAALLKEAKELGIDVSKYTSEEKKPVEQKAEVQKEGVKEIKKDEKKDEKNTSTNDIIMESFKEMTKTITEAMKNSSTTEEKKEELPTLYG